MKEFKRGEFVYFTRFDKSERYYKVIGSDLSRNYIAVTPIKTNSKSEQVGLTYHYCLCSRDGHKFVSFIPSLSKTHRLTKIFS